jgi:hypothetical protein
MTEQKELFQNQESLAAGDRQGRDAKDSAGESASLAGTQNTGERSASPIVVGWYYERNGCRVRSYRCDGWEI